MKKIILLGVLLFTAKANFGQAIGFDELVKMLKMTEYDQSQYLSNKGWNQRAEQPADTLIFDHTGNDTTVSNAYCYIVSVQHDYSGPTVTIGLHFTTRTVYDQYISKIHAMQMHTAKSETKGNISTTEYGNKDYSATVKKIRTDYKHNDYFVDVTRK